MRPRGGSFDERKEFGRFSAADAALLAQLRPDFERHADEIVAAFYEHLGSRPELQAMLAPEGTVERLQDSQRRYLLSLVTGCYDESYARGRVAIGEVHDRIGLAPEWYLGAYGLYVDMLMPLIQQRFAPDGARAAQAGAALTKLLVLDMQLVLDAYYGLRQQRAVESSAQLAAVGQLAASIAHEVRNPLAGMKGALQVLDRELPAAHHEIVGELLAQIERLEQLVRDLLTYARPRELSRVAFDLHELLDRLLRFHEQDAHAQGLAIRRSYGPATERLVADPAQMEQVFLNLVHNALQAMAEGGTLTVRTAAQDGAITVSFADTGRGIPAADLPKVMLPFFTTKHRGSGLGLSIVRRIVEAHGGTIAIASEAGAGTTVTISVPSAEHAP